MAEEIERNPLPDWRGCIGFGVHREAFTRLIRAGNMPPVVLFEGREGLGKSALAAMAAATYLCDNHTACGECDGCKWVMSGEHPEVFWLESNTGKILLEDAAALQDFLSLNPEVGTARIAVIVDADQLMIQAANRLLKTLEEPPQFGKIILTTSKPQYFLDTILSRCVKWKITPPPAEETADLVRMEFEKNTGRLPGPAEMAGIMKRSGMAPGKALAICASEDTGDEDAIVALDEAKSLSQVVQMAETTARSKGVELTDLLVKWEMMLNKKYIQTLKKGSPEQPMVIAQRRKILREARQLAERSKIALNSQLVVESLAGAKWFRAGVN